MPNGCQTRVLLEVDHSKKSFNARSPGKTREVLAIFIILRYISPFHFYNKVFSMIIPRSLGTHSGTFHADEVTACALLLVYDLIDRDKIIRTRDITKLSTCEFVCDVGGEYDPLKKRSPQ